ncbi:TPA: hypothetical protein T7M05_001860 [Streptococcus suis]|uniref:hypothetical protein n=1 Tax=Streptococcus suis TaxID=1307 RepID=UPI0009453AA1|nr:hypothetical protein [Streptococcus suis]HEL2706224.1 hypothetical protein [Streptococcus suis]HEL2737499.1 hypothetical protein [Streptococcus suis]HEM2763851.1 hypothetical protein [Streptococcus suis]
MKPRKYPYSGRQRLVRKEMPRFIQLGNIAIDSKLINNIETFEWVGPNETVIHLKTPKLFTYEEKQITVQLKLWQVLKILNRY